MAKNNYQGLVGFFLFVVITLFSSTGCGEEAVTTTAPSNEALTSASFSTTMTPATAPTATSTAGVNYPGMVFPKMVANSTGGPKFDVEKWKATPAAEKLLAYMKNSYIYEDEMDPALLAYWEERGIKKELHDTDDQDLKWASYTPREAFDPGNTQRFPVVFCFHGAYGSIFGAEGYGIAEIGAKERYITVCAPTHPKGKPERVTQGLTAGAKVTRILDALEAGGYPIDRTRVYLTGQSMGGMTCAWAALEVPELIAAIAPHGAAACLNVDPDALNALGRAMPFVGVEEFAKMAGHSVPLFIECGDSDVGQLPLKTQGVIDGLNLWLEVDGCPTRLTLDECLQAQTTSTDPAVRLVGVPGDKTWTNDIDGVTYHGVEFYALNGTRMIMLVGVENCPHWVTAAYPELAWEFMSHFSKVDGKLVVNPGG